MLCCAVLCCLIFCSATFFSFVIFFLFRCISFFSILFYSIMIQFNPINFILFCCVLFLSVFASLVCLLHLFCIQFRSAFRFVQFHYILSYFISFHSILLLIEKCLRYRINDDLDNIFHYLLQRHY